MDAAVEAGVNVDRRFVDLLATREQLITALESDTPPPSKSRYCMEQGIIHGKIGDCPRFLERVGDKKCISCSVSGHVGADQKLKFCSRCRTAVYCSKACQKKDFKRHAKECVEQDRAPAPGCKVICCSDCGQSV